MIPPDPGLGPQLTYSVLAERMIRIYCSVQQVFPQPTLGLTIYTETAGGGARKVNSAWRGNQNNSQDNAGNISYTGRPTNQSTPPTQLRDSIYASENEKARLSQGGVTNDVIDSAVTSFVLQSIVQHGPPADRLCNKVESDTLIDHQTV